MKGRTSPDIRPFVLPRGRLASPCSNTGRRMRLPRGAPAVDQVLAAIHVEHRHAALGEAEVVGAIVIAGLRRGIGRRHPAEIGQRGRENGIELAFAAADDGDVARRPGE